MRSRLGGSISAISLLLRLGSGILWIRSYWVCDAINRTEGYGDALGNDFRQTELFSEHGLVGGEDYVHIQGHGAFAGGAFRKPTGVVYEYDHYTATVPVFSLTRVINFLGVPTQSGEYHFLGFAFLYRDQEEDAKSSGFRSCTIAFAAPWAAVVVATGVLPILWGYKLYKRRRLKDHDAQLPCPKCGYSLIGNTSGVCPECGNERVVGTDKQH